MKAPTRVTRGSFVSFGSSASDLPSAASSAASWLSASRPHRAELDHPEALAVAADPLLAVEDGARARHLDRDRRGEETGAAAARMQQWRRRSRRARLPRRAAPAYCGSLTCSIGMPETSCRKRREDDTLRTFGRQDQVDVRPFELPREIAKRLVPEVLGVRHHNRRRPGDGESLGEVECVTTSLGRRRGAVRCIAASGMLSSGTQTPHTCVTRGLVLGEPAWRARPPPARLRRPGPSPPPRR